MASPQRRWLEDDEISLLCVLIISRCHSSKFLSKPNSIFNTLLDCGADVNEVGGVFGSVLQAAIHMGAFNVANTLIDRGANIHAAGGMYENAFIAAMLKDDDLFVSRVTGCEASLSQSAMSKALYKAIKHSSVKRTKLLVDRGVDINMAFDSNDPWDKCCRVPLTSAAMTCSEDCVSLLLDSGATIDAWCGYDDRKWNALIGAAQNGMVDNMRLLIDRGALIDAEPPTLLNREGDGTALHTALACFQTKPAGLLIEQGANVNALGYTGGTRCRALQAAIHSGQFVPARMMVEKGADVNAVSGRYCTALQAAVSKGNLDMVKYLLDHGADVHVEGGVYGNALQAALDEQHAGIADLLIEYKAVKDRDSSPSSEEDMHTVLQKTSANEMQGSRTFQLGRASTF